MDIFINNQKAEVVIENEKNAFEVIMALSDFAAKQSPQHFISNIIVDRKEYSFADEDRLKAIKVREIKKIELETNDIYGITNLTMTQIERFLELLKEIFNDKSFNEKIIEIKESIAWMTSGVNKILQIFSINKNEKLKQEKDIFNEYCDELTRIIDMHDKIPDKDNNELTVKIKDEALTCISGLSLSLKKIKKWLVFTCNMPDKDFVLENINKLLDDISRIIPSLGNMPLLFQTGEDNEAMNIIHSLSTILEESIEMFVLFKENFKLHLDKYTVKEVSFEEFFKTITLKLKELIEAIEKNDSVLISDLLEYEFIPNVEEIQNIIEKIKTELFEKIN
jgi:hypothetical protein